MGYLRRPVYYKEFQCIASACTDTCCAGWEIDVDDETLEKYRGVKEDFAKRLWSEIELPENEDGEPAHFKLAKCDRCPFLNEENLCDIFINLGEDYLSYICTHHPRYYEWYMGGKEAGLGLVCEAAAELILRPNTGEEFEEIAESSEPEEDLELENQVFALRDRLFDVIHRDSGKGVIGTSEDKKEDPDYEKRFDLLCDDLWEEADNIQMEYDEMLFGEEELTEEELTEDMEDQNMLQEDSDAESICNARIESEKREHWSAGFWSEQNLLELLEFYQHLEINDPNWWMLLEQMKQKLPMLLEHRKPFLTYYAAHAYEYDRLLIYFLYRYFMKARYDGELKERVAFALISTCMIQLVDIYHWMMHGALEHKAQIDICKMYAKEIEYDEGNVDEINHCFVSSLLYNATSTD